MDGLLPAGTCYSGLNSTSGVAATLITGLITTILRNSCELDATNEYPDDVGFNLLPEYDFIIVGAGSTGSVIANRLSEISNWKILLLEAGDNPSVQSDIPGLYLTLQNTSETWRYKLQPEEFASFGIKGKISSLSPGKVLGGTSTVNAMAYVRANRLDYDNWANMGFTSWNYSTVLHYFKKSENFILENEYHSMGGYLDVRPIHFKTPISHKLIEAATQMGYEIHDINGESQVGYNYVTTTTKNGIRESTAKAFLVPIKSRSNIHVMKRALATKLHYDADTNTINGVNVLKDGIKILVHANKEIIVSSGAIGSPHLLMASGIGPRNVLENAGVTVIKDIPEVGRNLQDHTFSLGFAFELKNFDTHDNKIDAMYEFLTKRNGSLTRPAEVIGFINTPNNSNKQRPDIQLLHMVIPKQSNNNVEGFIKRFGLFDETANILREANTKSTILIIVPLLLRPKSRGKIELISSNIEDHPLIYGNLLKESSDVETILDAVDYILNFSKTDTMMALGAELIITVPSCKNGKELNKSYWECAIRHLTTCSYHMAGTCAMGNVVDESLQVHGLNGLRVADASVMPNVVSGNTNAPCIMIGEKVSDDIKRSYGVLN